ncbi:MAG: fructose-6-phosphate aldolase [Phenylobacterium sp.]|jgi:transaldolase|uniref:fructose-6-phosphate aldolase n=1 Tax=unclassified Phenylobacterium TaxID=2640670 RepID=UPI0008C8292B|nr:MULTISPECIES: fructose-6-phosphate aldolase [unclassified Phenylobacterium]MBJ7412393.1 fructose-6-phosphate aldolase [Phenylobacterium sp.]OHB29467.1 MAG: fructose-6-phosphate aldolase [Phenylobacterium sp. RIFCSPHIGHO2_01_FULL_69_31]
MQLFLDTTDTAVLKDLAATGLVDGVTTNPSLIAKSGRNMLEVIAEICSLVDGPVSAEVAAMDTAGMLDEGRKLAGVAPNVVVKVPLTRDGLIATREFAAEGILTNVTLCFSPAQALLAAKSGATYISPFIGRLDDHGATGMDLITEIRAIYDNYDFDTEILAASIRTPAHVAEAALAGADCATIPPDVFEALFKHPLTERGLQQFMADWAKTGQSIL